jgi:hypothetical protein
LGGTLDLPVRPPQATDAPLLPLPSPESAPPEKPTMMQQLSWLHTEFGISILLIGQDALSALEIADYGYIMEGGRIVYEGVLEKLNHKDVQEFYLGSGDSGRVSYRAVKQVFPFVVIQEAGLDGFWIDRALQNEGIESHVVDPASIATSRRRRRAKTDRIDGDALVRALLAYKRGEPRVCAMVKAPTPEEEDRRRLCRERKVLIAERVRHVNRVKGLLFSQGISGYEPLRRDRRERLDTLQPDGRLLPDHLKAQVRRELDRLELLLKQIKAVEAERNEFLHAVGEGTLWGWNVLPGTPADQYCSTGINLELAAKDDAAIQNALDALRAAMQGAAPAPALSETKAAATLP